jgi:hypothetical protein
MVVVVNFMPHPLYAHKKLSVSMGITAGLDTLEKRQISSSFQTSNLRPPRP